MPFRLISGFDVLTSDDLDRLQDAYEVAVAGLGSLDDATIHDVVGTMIAVYRAGTTAREDLAEIAREEIRRMAG